MSEHVYIYVIGREEGPVKVGISAKPWRRVSNIQTSCPFKVALLYVMPTKSREKALEHEKIMHLGWEAKKSSGEWFDMDADEAIEAIETGFEIEEFYANQRAHDLIREKNL